MRSIEEYAMRGVAHINTGFHDAEGRNWLLFMVLQIVIFHVMS